MTGCSYVAMPQYAVGGVVKFSEKNPSTAGTAIEIGELPSGFVPTSVCIEPDGLTGGTSDTVTVYAGSSSLASAKSSSEKSVTTISAPAVVADGATLKVAIANAAQTAGSVNVMLVGYFAFNGTVTQADDANVAAADPFVALPDTVKKTYES